MTCNLGWVVLVNHKINISRPKSRLKKSRFCNFDCPSIDWRKSFDTISINARLIETRESNSLTCLVFIFILSKISKCICVWSSRLETWTPTLTSYTPQTFILVECLVKLDIDLITPYGIIVDSILPTPIYIMNMVSSKHLLPKIEHNFFFLRKRFNIIYIHIFLIKSISTYNI